MTTVQIITQFHQMAGCPIPKEPTMPSKEVIDFRTNFIDEEVGELLEARATDNLTELADALGDIQVVLDGLWLHSGFAKHKEAIVKEINRSNLSKFCDTKEIAQETANRYNRTGIPTTISQVPGYDCWRVNRASDGKMLKSIHYSKPDLSQFIPELV